LYVDGIDTSRQRVEKTVICMHMAGDVDSLRHKMCGAFVTNPVDFDGFATPSKSDGISSSQNKSDS
jgi:hypothetical protein